MPRRTTKTADRYFGVDPWKITEDGYDPSHGRVSESVFSLANGHIGVRGFFDEGGSVDSLPGCYMSGVYEVDETLPRSYKGIIDRTHFMVSNVNWLSVSLRLDGEKLDLAVSRFRDFKRTLDMRTGTLERRLVWITSGGKELELRFLRFLDMHNVCRAYQQIEMTPLNFSGHIDIACKLDFNSVHEAYGKCFWEEEKSYAEESGGRACIIARTKTSRSEVFAGFLVDAPVEAKAPLSGDKKTGCSMRITLESQKTCRVRKLALLLGNRDARGDLWAYGRRELNGMCTADFDDALRRSEEFWSARWETADVLIEGDPENQQGVRFCAFQMAQTFQAGRAGSNLGAKGLTGEFYNGHAFWDTEIYCMPYYLFNDPDAARQLLEFRRLTLPQAKERARTLDCDGACYPVATLNGEEACSLWQHASLQMQTGTAVAHALSSYSLVTGDKDYLYNYGAVMLFEIARYLTSRVGKNPKTGEYGFYGVMGPDEFHMMVNNNCYTNYMGKKTLLFAADTLEAMAGDDGHSRREAAQWREIARSMSIPQDAETGIFEQHDGYFTLPHTDIGSIPAEQFPLYHHWSYDRIYRSDMLKQPDVLMMIFLNPDGFTQEEKRANYDYYEPRTVHESSLSPSVHSILSAELGRTGEALSLFEFSTRLDLDNYNRNSGEGLHIASIAAAWMNIVYGFAGLRADASGLSLSPQLPDTWRHLRFGFVYHGSRVEADITGQGVSLRVKSGKPVSLKVYGERFEVGPKGVTVPVRDV